MLPVMPQGHPRGVVGNNSTDGAGGFASRIGAKFATVAGEGSVDLANCRPRLHANAHPVSFDSYASEISAHVDKNAIGEALTTEAGAARTQGDGHSGASPDL